MSGSKINILYEDNHILIVEKPVNIPVQEDASGDPDMLSILKQDIKIRYNKPGNVYLGLVHRLDRPVGGVMAFARTSKAASRLSEQIRTRSFQKTYLAVIHGKPEKSQGSLKHYLEKDSRTNTVRVVNSSDNDGKLAVLEYEVLDNNGQFALVQINLLTGRSHQIRVQFAATGHPLYGDQKYGGGVNKPGQQIALWSYKLVLQHPTKGDAMSFRSNPPAEYPWNVFSMPDS